MCVYLETLYNIYINITSFIFNFSEGWSAQFWRAPGVEYPPWNPGYFHKPCGDLPAEALREVKEDLSA